MKFATFAKGSPCPVCQIDDGACRHSREDLDFIFCHRFADVRLKEVVNGFVCVKESGSGHTASFKPDNTQEWTFERKREWEERQADRKQKAIEEKQARQENALSTSERHHLYQEILDRLTLDHATVSDLKERGFTDEEIANSGFKSVSRGQKLNKSYDSRLPGIKDGRFLAVGGDGYLCPVRNFDGEITGIQLRLHNPQDDNRYRWLSTPDRAILKLQPEDENPLAVFHPPSGKPEGIAIVEGTGAKPFFVSQKLNYLVIGAAGGQWLSSPKLFEKYIKQAFEKYGELPIIFIPDAGFALNPQVKQKLADTSDWLKKHFGQSEIKFLDWNQLHKSQGDIDELADLSIIRTLSLESFFKKYKEVFAGSKGFGRFQNWASTRVKLTSDIIQHEQWLSIPKEIENECDILLIRKDLGGGKTQALIEYLKPKDAVSLLVGYRNTLLFNTINRANSMGLEAQHIKDSLDIVDHKVINFAADDSIKLWGGCADSFFKFNTIIDRNPDYYLIHDEICSVLGHLKGGGTLKGRQQQAINWDVNTIRNSKFSIMMDANLSDKDVEFLKLLFPEKRIKVLDSRYPTTPRTFYFLETATEDKDYTANPKYLPTQLIEIAKSSNRVLWISDSQRSCEVTDEILTKHGHKHFRLDGKTSHDELAKQFQSNPKSFITTESLDSVSISPSGESGLSIDLYDYFDAVCFDIRGTVSVNTLTQLSARLRDIKVPIYVACPEFVNMTSDPCPYAIKHVNEVINQRIEMLLAKSLEVDGELVDSEFVMDMFAKMGENFASDPWFIESLKDAKQLKYEHQNLKLCLKTALSQAGHRVIDLVKSPDEEQHEEVKETKETVKRREAQKVFNSEDITWEQFQELSKKDVNYDDKCKIRKAKIKHKLPGIEDTQSWNADFIYTIEIDDPKFLDARWRLMQLQNDELANAVFKTDKKFNFENSFTPQDAWKSTSTKIEALKLLGVGKLIEADVFSCQDGWVQQIVDQYYDSPDWFGLIGIPPVNRLLNSDGKPKNLKYVKEMIDKFLDYFGIKPKSVKKIRGNRIYVAGPAENFQDFLPDIDGCLNRRAESVISESQNLSLKAASEKAQNKQREEQEWEERHQAELNKRMLESQLTHSHSDLGCRDTIYIYSQKESRHPHLDKDIPTTDEDDWTKPETIADVAGMLGFCETPKMLAELRECNIPPEVFKIASRQLPSEKREQIRAWVLGSRG